MLNKRDKEALIAAVKIVGDKILNTPAMTDETRVGMVTIKASRVYQRFGRVAWKPLYQVVLSDGVSWGGYTTRKEFIDWASRFLES